MILDCHTRKSTLKSISLFYDIPSDDIEAFLKKIDLEFYYSKNSPNTPAHITITNLLEKEFLCSPSKLSQVSWFHLTRVQPNEFFERGILPLNKAIISIWDMLSSILLDSEKNEKIRILRKEGVSNRQYNLKVKEPIHGGPYAMLVRESAFRAVEMGNHDYLKLPEIVEDICHGYEKRFGESIMEYVIDALVPRIVKFQSKKRLGRECIEAAIYYLYLTIHKEDLICFANTCFDGQNLVIPKEDIISIETL